MILFFNINVKISNTWNHWHWDQAFYLKNKFFFLLLSLSVWQEAKWLLRTLLCFQTYLLLKLGHLELIDANEICNWNASSLRNNGALLEAPTYQHLSFYRETMVMPNFIQLGKLGGQDEDRMLSVPWMSGFTEVFSMWGPCKAREIRDEWDATALQKSTDQSWVRYSIIWNRR